MHAEFQQVQYIDLRKILQFVQAIIIAIIEHLKLSTLFVSLLWSVTLGAKVSPEWRLNPGFGTQKKVSLSPD